MKYFFSKPLLIVLGTALMLPVALLAQKDEKDKEKKDKDKEKKEVQQVIITRNGDNDEKIVVEVNGDNVTVNGKPLIEYKGDNVIIRHNRKDDTWAFADGQNSRGLNSRTVTGYKIDSNRAMLGVTTDKADKGVEINDITDESGADKAGLKEGDVITKIDDKTIDDPDDLSKVIKSHKPGDKVTVTYLRDDKEQKVTAELGRWKGASVYATTPGYNMSFDAMPRIQSVPRIKTTPYGQNFSWSGGGPKLGLSVQDTDDGKGVKVIEVDEESNAEKAGIKEDDIITEVEGKAVNGADEVAKIIKESKDKTSVMIKLTRSGKTQNIEVKIPRKLKTADL
jgi:serine protease Do